MNAELRELVDRCGRVRDRLASALQGADDAALNRRPDEGGWSAGEVVLHLNAVNGPYLRRTEELVERTRANGLRSDGPFRYGWFEKWFVSMTGPDNQRKVKTVRFFEPEPKQAGRADVETLDAGLGRLREVMEGADGLDLAALKTSSPATKLVRFRLGMLFRLLVAHTERHAGQIERAIAGS